MKSVKFKIASKSREGGKKKKCIQFFGSQRKSIHPNCFSPLLFFLWVTKKEWNYIPILKILYISFDSIVIKYKQDKTTNDEMAKSHSSLCVNLRFEILTCGLYSPRIIIEGIKISLIFCWQ